MSKARKFAHQARFDFMGGGRMRVTCCCGKLSPVFKNDLCGHTKYAGCEPCGCMTAVEKGELWHIDHTGLREITPKGES